MDRIKNGWPLAILLPFFIGMVALQLYVPASMIIEKETTLKKGTAYKFKTAPVDPYDPFRGKYVWLDFRNDWVNVASTDFYKRNETVYATVVNDSEGFAQIASVSRIKPQEGIDYMQVKTKNKAFENSQKLRVEFPFDRLYMEESKAYEAETSVRVAQRDTSHQTYALVKIYKGNAVLENVYIDDTSLKEFVEKKRLEKQQSNE